MKCIIHNSKSHNSHKSLYLESLTLSLNIIVCKRINRSRAICPKERPSIRDVREKRRGILVLRRGFAARKWITTAVEKTFKVNIVKIHFLPAIRFYSFPLVPAVSPSPPPPPSLPSLVFASFARVPAFARSNTIIPVWEFPYLRALGRFKAGDGNSQEKGRYRC